MEFLFNFENIKIICVLLILILNKNKIKIKYYLINMLFVILETFYFINNNFLKKESLIVELLKLI